MENKILSLDLGSNSIGATIRDLSNKENQFKKTTVITFETGVGKDDKGKFTLSHAAERTSKRSLRRLYKSRKYKLWKTLGILGKDKKYCPIDKESLSRWRHYDKTEAIKGNGGRTYPINDTAFNNWIKLDFNNDGIPDYPSPYLLREELATIRLDFTTEENRFKLGRTLYHIAQHRGFKSSKKVQNVDDENDENEGENYDKDKGAEGKKRTKFWQAIEKLNLGILPTTTVGQSFSLIEKNNKQNKTNIRIRKELHQFVTRKMLKEEIETIFKFQDLDFKSIFENKAIMQSAIFWQQPLRSQKGTIGKCTLEPNKYRCPVSYPAFEEFRAWSFLNNIKYTIKGDKDSKPQQIPLEYRKGIYTQKFFRVSIKDFYFYEIAEWIKIKNGHDKWQLNYDYKTNVASCPVSAKMKDIFGDDWQLYHLETDKLKKVKKKNGTTIEHKTSYNIDAIWHILFDSDDEDIIENFATDTLKLEPKKINKFIALFKSMPVAYGMLSLKAINNILPFLREGLIYTEATLLAKVPKILGDDIWFANKSNILSILQLQVIDKNREEKRILNIANNLIAQYKSNDNKFAERNFDYNLGDNDSRIAKNSEATDANQILKAIEDSFGKHTWEKQTQEKQKEIIEQVSKEYQTFFADKERKFKKLPHLQLSMKCFLADNFDFLNCPNTFKELKDGEKKCRCSACKKLNSLYHPSQIDIYPPAKEGFYKYGDIQKRMVMLGSPETNAFKNPMALRALHELRKYVNYLIATEQVDEQTRIVVEIPRDSNLDDNNKRWAWTEYQARREKENKEFRDAIYELLKDPEATGTIVNPDNDSDIDKFRIWYEMLEGQENIEGFEEKKIFIPLEKTTSIKKSKIGREKEIEGFNENSYLKINKSFFFKLQKAKDNIQAKYQLWKEQGCSCIYTGRIINLTDLFQENVVDFEHTIPRSKSLDNSLANLTVCYADFNRNIKKNQIPFQLDNYAKSAYGYNGSILSRLEKWEQKVKDLELHVEFWKTKSKRGSKSKMISPGSNISEKDFAIRQRYLWNFELKYWHDKVSRFRMEEIKGGFRKSQLVDTQIISKYALHYLKTFFNTVDVQKGENTAVFRKIFGIQEIGTEKDRSKHSHHAKDAIILSLIPPPVIREQMLTIWYEIHETKSLLKSETESDKRALQEHIVFLEEKLKQLKYQCNLPNVNAEIDKVDEQILINNIAKDNTLTIAKRRIRSRGKIVPLKDEYGNIVYQTDENENLIQRTYKDGNLVWKNDELGKSLFDEKGNKIPVYKPKEKWAKGDSIRGRLHKDSFLGVIKLVRKDEEGNWIKNVNGEFKFEEIKYVIREELVYKKNEQSPGFKTLKELEDIIVDKSLFAIIKLQVNAIGNFKDALAQGIWMLDKAGDKVNKIRHIRCFVTPRGAIEIKKHSHLSKHKHKHYFVAENAETPFYGLYKNETGKYEHECRTLWEISKMKTQIGGGNLKDFFSKKVGYDLEILSKGLKLFILKENSEDYKMLPRHEINKRIYSLIKFYKKEGYIQMQFHLDARDNNKLKKDFPEDKWGKRGINGFSEPNFETPHHRLLLSKKNFCFLIEGKEFKFNPDGEIVWI